MNRHKKAAADIACISTDNQILNTVFVQQLEQLFEVGLKFHKTASLDNLLLPTFQQVDVRASTEDQLQPLLSGEARF